MRHSRSLPRYFGKYNEMPAPGMILRFSLRPFCKGRPRVVVHQRQVDAKLYAEIRPRLSAIDEGGGDALP
jgi:hypothetical protein